MLVLPTEPVTAMILAGERARAARARSRKASSTSATVKQRRVGGELRAFVARDDREAGAGFERGLDEVMAVAVVALDGEEGVAFAERAAVDR